MNAQEKELAQIIQEMIRTGFIAQDRRVRNMWEPRVRGVLINAADAAQHQLHPLLILSDTVDGDNQEPPTLADVIQEIINSLATKHANHAASILWDMVRDEVRETLEILTMNGLTEDIPPRFPAGTDPSGLNERLSGAMALYDAVDKATLEFTGRVLALVPGSSNPSVTEAARPGLLAKAVRWWRSRLATIANTTVHAVFNRSKQAAADGLA